MICVKPLYLARQRQSIENCEKTRNKLRKYNMDYRPTDEAGRELRFFLLCARRRTFLKGESPEPARQWEGYSRTPRVSAVRRNLKEGVPQLFFKERIISYKFFEHWKGNNYISVFATIENAVLDQARSIYHLIHILSFFIIFIIFYHSEIYINRILVRKIMN